MKQLIGAIAILLFCASGEALAQRCATATQVTGTALSTLITGNTVCAVRGSERWQEQHLVGGDLWDYKLGPGHAIDPSKKVGTWSVDTTASTVTYLYTGGPTFTYTLHNNAPGVYSFCVGVAPIVTGARFTGTIGPCP
jgi:hypothetical protein